MKEIKADKTEKNRRKQTNISTALNASLMSIKAGSGQHFEGSGKETIPQ